MMKHLHGRAHVRGIEASVLCIMVDIARLPPVTFPGMGPRWHAQPNECLQGS